MSKAVIGVHAYDGKVTGGKDFKHVMHDRLSKTFEFASKTGFESIQIVVMGGERVHSFLKSNFAEEFEEHSFLLTGDHKDTKSEVDFLFKKSRILDADICYSVSSKDHVSRIVEYWAKKDRGELDAAVVPSDETYSKSGEEPVVVEPAVFEELRHVIAENLGDIQEDQVGEIAEDIEKVFKKYKN
ncbi:hypothetical protein [Candidatus Nanohalobium constans]|uniref:DUF218 domain-containing protein n=1 Tax=Candidatus Nanohalobium constans TaxID=2565781 RepID=A0A5Q0UFY4_9ARCH|nr:hypothetical protein [Candidatus Nanohalobium constans]QGA80507.1 hypothetical protein LC1Nh_0614 [Candidatus Nanohalobium constans]